VLARYPLDSPRIIERLAASVRNDSYLIEGADSRYVLRRYRRNPDGRRIRFQLAFQRELGRRGYPTSEIVPSSQGELFVAGPSGLWVLFTYVEGAEYDFANMGQVAEAGRRLALFHNITRSIELEEVVLDINPQLRRWWTHGDEELAALEEMFRNEGVEEELAFLRTWHAGLVRDLPLERFDALPAGWVHADFHGRNMVFAGEELRGLFDFDPLHRSVYVGDVAHALFMFGRESRGSTRIRPDAARTFLGNYERERKLADAEREALPAFGALAWVPNPAYQALVRRDGEDTVAHFRRYVQLMRDLQSEMERLRAVLYP